MTVKQALAIREQFPEHLCKIFSKIWCGDEKLMKWIAIIFANGFVSNADEGLHLYVSGPSGMGKSEGIKAALKLLPKDNVISGGFSRKAILYHAKNFPSGSVLFQDDHIYDKDEMELNRAILAGWKESYDYFTVDKQTDRKISLPKRLTRIVTNISAISEEASEGQDSSRFITIEINRSQDQLREIYNFLMVDEQKDITEDLPLIMEVWNDIKKGGEIKVPYKVDIQCKDEGLSKLREVKKFLTTIKSIATLRGHCNATLADFYEAAEMFNYLTLMQTNVYDTPSKCELEVLQAIKDLTLKTHFCTVAEICNQFPKKNQPSIYAALRGGHGGTFQEPTGGLLTKIPELRATAIYDKETGRHNTELSFVQRPELTALPFYLSNTSSYDSLTSLLPTSTAVCIVSTDVKKG
jgi:hypothetical protein